MINHKTHLEGLDCIGAHAYFEDNSNICNISIYQFSHIELSILDFFLINIESNIFQLNKDLYFK